MFILLFFLCYYENVISFQDYNSIYGKKWHRSSGDLNDVLIDPAEDWSQVQWSRDHSPSRELISNRFFMGFEIKTILQKNWTNVSRELTFNRFPRLNFEIGASGWPTTTFKLLTSKFRWLKRRFNRSSGRLITFPVI